MASPRSHHRVPWPQQQRMQMGPTMTSCDACTAAGRALVPRGMAGGCFASAKSHLKSFVEHKGALSTLERCTGASHNAFAHCLRLLRACQGPLPSALKLPTLLLTFALSFMGSSSEVRQHRRASNRRLACGCAHARAPHRGRSTQLVPLPLVSAGSSHGRRCGRYGGGWRAGVRRGRSRARAHTAAGHVVLRRGACARAPHHHARHGQSAAPRRPRVCQARQWHRTRCCRRLQWVRGGYRAGSGR